MSSRHLALVLVLTMGASLLQGTAHAELKLATLSIKGMVCQA
jgi:hypothetical protein